jgi:hypothetical protein
MGRFDIMDNTGNYVTPQELLDRLYPSPYVSYRSRITLADKDVNEFTYTGSTFVLSVGDIICQGEYATEVISLPTGKIKLADATNIEDGTAVAYRTTQDITAWNRMILRNMQIIDFHTGQWFNKREFTGDSKLRVEGNGSYLLHFSVPVISISSIKHSSEFGVVDPIEYMVYSSRVIPDDRRNPKVKLLRGSFYRHSFTEIEGAFGWLEQDGSTPELIKDAVSRLVMLGLTKDPTQTSSSPIKSEKTDLHEIQYAVSATSLASEQNSGRTGDPEVDRIIQLYKSPFSIGGTDARVKLNNSTYYDYEDSAWSSQTY